MQHLETLAGRLHITLHYAQEKGECRVCAVNIHSNRLRLRSQFFTGRPVETVPKLVGLLFSLCGTAQSIASIRACEQALGQTPNSATERQRDIQIGAETLFEHLLRLSQDWPKALGIEPVPAPALQPLLTLKRAPQSALPLVGQWIDQHLNPKLEALQTRIQQNGWERLGDYPLHALPDLPPEWWESRLTTADAETFMAIPDVNGQACETSALTRQWDKPGLQPWKAAYGNGLLTRLQARVLDMRECWQSLREPLAPPLIRGGWERFLPEGLALLQTARGLLVHRVTQQNGLIRDYQIVAPTEWNFHPQGSLQNMLATLTGKDEADLTQQARILITALDPCVDYQLEIVPDA